MPQFLDDLSVASALHMQRAVSGQTSARFTARFVIDARPLRLVKEFDFSDHPEAVRSLRRIANAAFAVWLQALAANLAAGTAVSAVQIDVDGKGWAKVILRHNTDGLGDVIVDIPEAEDFGAMEQAAIAKLEEIVSRTLQSQEEVDGVFSWGRHDLPIQPTIE